MSKYAGQKVRFIGDFSGGFTHGEIYEAINRYNDDSWVSVAADDDGAKNGDHASFFELVEERPCGAKFKVGDRLRCLFNLSNEFRAGKIYEACNVPARIAAPDGKIGIVANDEGYPSWWYAEHFELVVPEKPADDAPHIIADSLGPQIHIYKSGAIAVSVAKELAEANPGTEYSIYARVAGYRADKPVAQEVA